MCRYCNRILLSLLLMIVTSFFSCGQKESEKEGKVLFDTIPVTNITIAPEYYFAGNFAYFADAAVLKENSTGVNLPVAMEGAFITAEKEYLALKLQNGTPVFAEIRGYIKQKGKNEEGLDRQLVITQVVSFDPIKNMDNKKILIGNYQSKDQNLQINPDHSYKLSFGNGETEVGKWYLIAEDILIFNSKDDYTFLDINYSNKELSMKDDSQIVFKKM